MNWVFALFACDSFIVCLRYRGLKALVNFEWKFSRTIWVMAMKASFAKIAIENSRDKSMRRLIMRVKSFSKLKFLSLA
jgi:hypothetical protein